jgi:hypothetical protein
MPLLAWPFTSGTEPGRSSPVHTALFDSPILMRRCYLHIGTHKTGTSSIQRSLAQAPLPEAGFYFPNTGKWTTDSGHHGLASAASSVEHDALVDSLIEEISLVPYDIVLSSEEFTHMLWRNAQGFQRLIDRLLTVVDSVTVILYLRRQTDYLESNYLERLKSQFRLGFSAYAFARIQEDLAEFPLDYRRLIDVLDRVQNIDFNVRSYDGVRKSGVLTDFLFTINWPEEHPIEECRINESLPIVESLKNFCRAHFQRALSNPEERAIELVAQSLPARPRMEAKTRRELIQQFDACNRELSARFPLTAILQTIPDENEYKFNEWTGLGDEAPPHQDALWRVTLDQLFSRTFIEIVGGVSERLSATEAALENAQALALERYAQLETLQQVLAQTQQAPSQTNKWPWWRRTFKR